MEVKRLTLILFLRAIPPLQKAKQSVLWGETSTSQIATSAASPRNDEPEEGIALWQREIEEDFPYPRAPAMASGIANHIWTVEDIVKLIQ